MVTVDGAFAGPKVLGPEWFRTPSGQAMPHVDDCTFCQLCEAACPVHVPVAHLIAYHKTLSPKSFTVRIRDAIMARPHRTARLASSSSVVKSLAGLSSHAAMPHRVRSKVAPLGESLDASRGRVGVLRDCFTSGYDSGLWDKAAALLRLWGYDPLMVPHSARCCGAAAYAAGQPVLARRTGRQMCDQLSRVEDQVTMIVTLNATCDSTIRDEWPRYFGQSLNLPVVPFEEVALTAPDLFWDQVASRVGESPWIVHSTCRGRVARGEGVLYEVFAKTGAVELSTTACCGAAGAYALKVEHEETARTLAERLVRQAQRMRPQGIVTDSGTCALHIQSLTGVVTRHPAAWLYDRYRRASSEVAHGA